MNEIVESKNTGNQAIQVGGIDRLIQVGFAQNAPVDQLERLFNLKKRYDDDLARNAYVKAMAEFKRNPPKIIKDKQVSFKGTAYSHATLGAVTEAVIEALAAHGFSHRWQTEQDPANGRILVTCVITHEQGHSESTTLSSKADESGSKNPIQAMASANTYLQRYTLLSAIGLATHDQHDDDGRAAAPGEEAGPPFDLGEWLEKVVSTTNRRELESVWKTGLAVMQRSGDLSNKAPFRQAVAARGKAFEGEREAGQEG